MELGAEGLPVLPAKDQAEIDAMKRQAQEAELAALKLLGEDTSGAVQAKPLSMFNRVSSAARAAQRQTAQYLRLRASRDSKVSSAPSTPGSMTPMALSKAPEPEPMPAKATPVEPAKKPTKRAAKKPAAKKAGLLEAVEADVRAARAVPAAPKPAPSAEPPKPAVRAAREPAKAPEPRSTATKVY